MTATAPPTLVGLDWGTSSLRGYLMDAAGGVSDAVSQPWGIQHLPPGGFAEALAAVVAIGQALLDAGFRVIEVPLVPVGGITPAAMAAFVAAGANGFGLGSAICMPGMSAAAVRQAAAGYVAAWQVCR